MLVYVEHSNESVKHQYVRLARSQGYKVNIQKIDHISTYSNKKLETKHFEKYFQQLKIEIFRYVSY